MKRDLLGACVPWRGTVASTGYGRIGKRYAHRVAYEAAHGAIPDGFQIDHLCRNRICVNPDHLEAVTQQENLRRQQAAFSQFDPATHCRNGHERTASNTRWDARAKRRQCRACQAHMNREYRARKRGAA